MTEIKPEQPQVKKNTAKRIIAGTLVTLGASYMIGKIGKADFENYQDGVAKNKQNIEDEQAAKKIIDQNKVEEARRQALKEKVNTGNDYLDSLILRTVEEKEPTKKIDADEIQKLDFDKPVAPDGIFMLPPGTNFVEGKLKMGFVDTQTGDFYDLSQEILDYKDINDHPLWVYNKIEQSSIDKNARFQSVFVNDGEHAVFRFNIPKNYRPDISQEDLFFTILQDKIESGEPGTFNVICFYTKKITSEASPREYFKPGEIISYHFNGKGNDEVNTYVGNKDRHLNETLARISNADKRVKNKIGDTYEKIISK
jgi:cell division protein FtsB